MKSTGILMSAPDVRAILAGTKTQDRRAIKPQPTSTASQCFAEGGLLQIAEGPRAGHPLKCPYGAPGDQLVVREAGWERPDRTPRMMREGADTWEPYYYDADGLSDQDHQDFKAWGFKRRPSIFMPRAASRITLEITSVRVERLCDISEADAVAEGCIALAKG